MDTKTINQKQRREFWKHNIHPITGFTKITQKVKPADAPTFAHPNDRFIKMHA